MISETKARCKEKKDARTKTKRRNDLHFELDSSIHNYRPDFWHKPAPNDAVPANDTHILYISLHYNTGGGPGKFDHSHSVKLLANMKQSHRKLEISAATLFFTAVIKLTLNF